MLVEARRVVRRPGLVGLQLDKVGRGRRVMRDCRRHVVDLVRIDALFAEQWRTVLLALARWREESKVPFVVVGWIQRECCVALELLLAEGWVRGECGCRESTGRECLAGRTAQVIVIMVSRVCVVVLRRKLLLLRCACRCVDAEAKSDRGLIRWIRVGRRRVTLSYSMRLLMPRRR